MTIEPEALPRTLALETGHNFRDMGGYPTEDGRSVRWRRIFRSGMMWRIDGSDKQALRDLGIATICDFRTNSERAHRPTQWHMASTELVERDHDNSAGAMAELLRRTEADVHHVRDMMENVYREFPYEQADSYRTLFARLAAGRVPLVFNCSAGKDRTGVAAALLLTILGVPRAIIYEDYAITNEWVDALRKYALSDPAYSHLIRDKPHLAMPMLRAEPEYLDIMFDVILSGHGSVERYLQEVIDVTPKMLETIRAALLE